MTPENKRAPESEKTGTSEALDEAMSETHKLAISEKHEYDSAPPEERKRSKDMAYFISAKYPERSSVSVQHRNRLNRAGDHATLFWPRVDAGMPLSTAVNLLRECERAWAKTSLKDRRTARFDDVVEKRLAAYDSLGHLRIGAGGKVYRATSPTIRATRVAKGEVSARGAASSSKGVTLTQHRTIVRDAVAAWVGARVPKDDPRAGVWVAECMREVETVLESFTQRFTAAKPKRDELFSACDLLNIPRPRWGKPADQKRAWKNRRSVLKHNHPDTLKHDGGLDAYQAINNAYNVIIAYNDSFNPEPNVVPSNETPNTNETVPTTTGESDVPPTS